MEDAPEKIMCQPWAVSNGVEDWSEGSFGRVYWDDIPSVQYTRSDLTPKWQPIETAPKDGEVLLFAEQTGDQFVAFFGTDVESGDTQWVFARSLNGPTFVVKDPTHWQPLPLSPEGGDGMYHIWTKNATFGWGEAFIAGTLSEAKCYAEFYAKDGDVKIKRGNKVVVRLIGMAPPPE